MNEIALFITSLGTTSLPHPLGVAAALALGLGWYWVMARYCPQWKWPLVGAMLLGAYPLIDLMERSHGIDPSFIVLDEFLAVPFLFLSFRPAVHQVFRWGGLIAVTAFAALDGNKPFFLLWVEGFPGAFGVLGDDIGAALMVSVALALAQRFVRFLRKPTALTN